MSMMDKDSVATTKVTKKPFILTFSERKGCTVEEATDIYEVFIQTLLDEVLAGNEVALRGFGIFSLKPHKGHKIQFSDNEKVDDYLILKFSASNTLNKKLRTYGTELLDKIQTDDKK